MEKKIMKNSLLETPEIHPFFGVYPLVIKDIIPPREDNIVILNNDCDISELNGHYDGLEFIAPKWYYTLTQKCALKPSILLINNLNGIPLNDQLKFIEILKYRKISTFELPKNCGIVVTVSDLEHKPLANEILSLVAFI